jgi:LmbE family N-acetylglucosaminyl deacetylase
VAVPDLLEARNVLCVQPHYDDNDIAVGGTLARLHELGARVTYVTVADDLLGVLDPELPDEAARPQLRGEQAAAGQHIGVAEQHWLDRPDAGRWDAIDLRDDLIRIMRRVRPDPRLRLDPDEPFEPHAISAVAFYWSHASNTTVDVSKHREAKHRAIDCYRTQFREDEMKLLHAVLEQREREYAVGLPYSHAERFKVLRSFQLHCDPGAWRA